MKFYFLSIIGLLLCFSTTAQHTKIGFVYEDYILANLPQTKKAQEDISTKKGVFETQLKAKAEKYKEKYSAYQDAMKDLGTATTESLNALLKEIQELKKDVEDSQAKAEADLRNMASEKLIAIQDQIEKTEKIIAKEKGYNFVFRRNVDYQGQETKPVLLYAINGDKDNLSDAILIKMGGTPPAKK